MNWKVIARSLKNRDMQHRILVVLGIIIIFRILTQVPIPLGDPKTLHQIVSGLLNSGSNSTQLLSFLNLFSGGALANVSIMIAGVGPYITAQWLMMFLTRAIPQLEALQKEGDAGQRKINQYTRILTLPMAIAQSIGSIELVRQIVQSSEGIDITAHVSIAQWVVMVAAISGGSMLLMWLGELITEQGIGNGASLFIALGAIYGLPQTISQINSLYLGQKDRFHLFGQTLPIDKRSLVFSLLALVAILLLTWLVVKLNEAARNIPIHYAKRVQGNRAYGGISTVMPIKLILVGVMSIFFAAQFLSVPPYIGQFLSQSHSARLQTIGTDLSTWFQTGTLADFQHGGFIPYIYPLSYFLFIVVFTYMLTNTVFNADQLAENLQKQGGFIEGVRSGKQTEAYLSRTINRLNFFGALALGVLALMPIIAQIFLGINVVRGTSILILVGVSLQTLRALESRALMVTYDQYAAPDFFADMSPDDVASPKKRRFSLLPFRRRARGNGQPA